VCKIHKYCRPTFNKRWQECLKIELNKTADCHIVLYELFIAVGMEAELHNFFRTIRAQNLCSLLTFSKVDCTAKEIEGGPRDDVIREWTGRTLAECTAYDGERREELENPTTHHERSQL